MNLSDRIVATIKTGVPTLWGLALAWLIARFPVVNDVIVFIDTHLAQITGGIPIATIIELALTAGVVAGFYWLAARINDRWPAVGRWLLGSSLVPVYVSRDQIKPAPSDVTPDATE